MAILSKAELDFLKSQSDIEENEKKEQPKKNRKPGTFSYDGNIKVSREEMSNLISSTRKWSKFPKVADDTEVIVRIEKFWDTCENTGEIPTWTNFCMCMGVNATTVDDWSKGKGCSKERTHMILIQKEMFRTIQDTLALNGKTAAVPYIWQSKQHLGYREPVNRIELETLTPIQELPDIASVESRYLEALPIEVLEDE